ncbi:DUF4870 domain-containing protein [Candidatus Pacearchaeota archaeon]|nr:DUF4870 domain-containing protein [Candidatus Pacearchaeota archaeon]
MKNKKADDSKLYAFLATFLSIIGLIIVLIADKKKDKYVMFYAKQGLVVFITSLIAGVIASFFTYLPAIGGIIIFALNLIIFVLWLISWIYALSGKMKEVPVVGKFGRKFNF